MLLYLAGNNRPDIAFAIHQCPRFSHAPKQSHELGLKHIVRYLRGAHEKGLVMTPDKTNLKVGIFADADFDGLF